MRQFWIVQWINWKCYVMQNYIVILQAHIFRNFDHISRIYNQINYRNIWCPKIIIIFIITAQVLFFIVFWKTRTLMLLRVNHIQHCLWIFTHIETLLRHIQVYSDIFSTLAYSQPCRIPIPSIFRTTSLYKKSCEMLNGHIQIPTVEQYSAISRHI